MDWCISLLTIICMWLLSRKVWWAPIFAVGTQFVWVGYVLYIEQYGLMMSTLVLLVIYATSIPKWRRERTTTQTTKGVYTCDCGMQCWVIYKTYIRCSQCGTIIRSDNQGLCCTW